MADQRADVGQDIEMGMSLARDFSCRCHELSIELNQIFYKTYIAVKFRQGGMN